MSDKLTPEQRHKNMSAIKSRNTRPEMAVRRFLHAHGYRYRLNVKKLPASPDIVLRRLQQKPTKRESTLQSLLVTLSQIELKLAASKNSVKYDFTEESHLPMVADDNEI